MFLYLYGRVEGGEELPVLILDHLEEGVVEDVPPLHQHLRQQLLSRVTTYNKALVVRIQKYCRNKKQAGAGGANIILGPGAKHFLQSVLGPGAKHFLQSVLRMRG